MSSRKIAFGASETLTLAQIIGEHLGIPWNNGKAPADASLINAAYAALQSLESDQVKFEDRNTA